MLGATTAGAVDGLAADLPLIPLAEAECALGGLESSRAMSNCSALLGGTALGVGGAADGFGLDLPRGACVGTGTGTTEAAEGLGGAADGGPLKVLGARRTG